MEISCKVLSLCLGLSLFTESCSGLPINLENTTADSHTQLLTGLVAVLLTVCSVVLLAGCLCCQRRNGFKEFRDSPVVAASATNLQDPGHINPVANGEFTIFTPLSPPHHNNNVFLANQQIITRTQEDYIYGDVDVSSWFDGTEKEFPRIKLKYIRELGKGWFGRVVEGAAQDISDQAWTPVAVRILDATASSKERIVFLHDAAIYRCGSHPNILQLLGRCLDTVPLLLLQEYCAQGDLKNYLLENKQTADKLLSTEYPLIWCCQLTSALKHLHDNKLTHPDLAARNCQLSLNLTLKLGDYGLAVFKYPEDYYQGVPGVPVRWCSPESITFTNTTIQPKKVTPEANIWSLGVTLWEICECGDLPYTTMSDDDVVSQVLGPPGVRLPRPSFSALYTDYIFRLMQLCWTTFESRPGIAQIDLMLSDLLQVHKNTTNPEKEVNVSVEDFDKRWESFKPNTIVKTDNHVVDMEKDFDDQEIGSKKQLSPSLNNLHGSLDNLLANSADNNQMESWLENVASKTGDMSFVRGLSDAIKDLDNTLALENTSSSDSSHQQSPGLEGSKTKVDFKLGPVYSNKLKASDVTNQNQNDSLTDSLLFVQRTSSESETEDENWKKKIERGAYSEKVRLKSKSVQDLMVLTHIDYSESESETPLPSLDYRINNYKNVRYAAPKQNLEGMSLLYGSEGNLLSVQGTFEKELKVLQEKRKDSLLFVPDNHSQNNSNNNNSGKLGEQHSVNKDSDVENLSSPTNNNFIGDSPSKRILQELNSTADIKPVNQVYNVFSVTIDKFTPIHVDNLSDIIINLDNKKELHPIKTNGIVDKIPKLSEIIRSNESFESLLSKQIELEKSPHVGRKINSRIDERKNLPDIVSDIKIRYPECDTPEDHLDDNLDLDMCQKNLLSTNYNSSGELSDGYFTSEELKSSSIENIESENHSVISEDTVINLGSDELLIEEMQYCGNEDAKICASLENNVLNSIPENEATNHENVLILENCLYLQKSTSECRIDGKDSSVDNTYTNKNRLHDEEHSDCIVFHNVPTLKDIIENDDFLMDYIIAKYENDISEGDMENVATDIANLAVENGDVFIDMKGKVENSSHKLETTEPYEENIEINTKSGEGKIEIQEAKTENNETSITNDEGEIEPTSVTKVHQNAVENENSDTIDVCSLDSLNTEDISTHIEEKGEIATTEPTIIEVTGRSVQPLIDSHTEPDHSDNKSDETTSEFYSAESEDKTSIAVESQTAPSSLGLPITVDLNPPTTVYLDPSTTVHLNPPPTVDLDLNAIIMKTNDFVLLEQRHYDNPKMDGHNLKIAFDLSESQSEVMPNPLTHSSLITTPYSMRSLQEVANLPIETNYSSLNVFNCALDSSELPSTFEGIDEPFTEPQESTQNMSNLNYSLETWDSFLGKALDNQSNAGNEMFDSFSSEPRSLLFIENGEPPTNLVPESLTDSLTEEKGVSRTEDDQENYCTMDSSSHEVDLNNVTIQLGKENGEDKTVTQVDQAEGGGTWEAGGGWFLHPQSTSDDISGEMVVSQSSSDSYVGFGAMDDEVMAAIRNELLTKLPQAQGASGEKVEEDEELDFGDSSEMIHLRYNLYKVPLSPILEESLSENNSGRNSPRKPSDDGSDWSDEEQEMLQQDTESQSAHTFESPVRGPLHRHTPSQDSCCSNDTLFNLEDLACVTNDQERQNADSPSTIVTPKDDSVCCNDPIIHTANNESMGQLPENVYKSDHLQVEDSGEISDEFVPGGEKRGCAETNESCDMMGQLWSESETAKNSVCVIEEESEQSSSDTNGILGEVPDNSVTPVVEPSADLDFITNFLDSERKCTFKVEDLSMNSDSNTDTHQTTTTTDYLLPFCKQQVAPLPSPEDKPWKQLPASQLSYDKMGPLSSSLEPAEEPEVSSSESRIIDSCEDESHHPSLTGKEEVPDSEHLYDEPPLEPVYENMDDDTHYDTVRNINHRYENLFTAINKAQPEYEKLDIEKAGSSGTVQEYENVFSPEEDMSGYENINAPKCDVSSSISQYENVANNNVMDTNCATSSTPDGYENVFSSENRVQPEYENIIDIDDIYNEADYVNIVNLENSKNNVDYVNTKNTEACGDNDADYVNSYSSELIINNDVEEDSDNMFGVLTDIRFNGPGDQLMSTSFSESNELNDEQDWDSGSDTRSSSSGEFIWKEGEHEESLKALHAAPQDSVEHIEPMEQIEESPSDDSSCTDEEGESPEFVPSAWDKYATPTKSALRSPEKTMEKTDKKKAKGVWFKKQKYHCVYEYPREPDSPVLHSYDIWAPHTDFSNFADTSNLDDEFYVSGSSKPFESSGVSCQFFPGNNSWFRNDNITPDSGVEDITPASLPDSEDFQNNLPANLRNVPTLKALVTGFMEREKQMKEIKCNDVLGGLRHTRNRLKLDLPPSPSAFTSSKVFSIEPNPDPIVVREKPSFTTFGKSRFQVQHVDTQSNKEPFRSKNVSFEVLPYKPMQREIIKTDSEELKAKTAVEMVRGEASLLDSADEDSGIESSTLERKLSSSLDDI